MEQQGKTKGLGEKPVPVPLHLQKIPHKLTWERHERLVLLSFSNNSMDLLVMTLFLPCTLEYII
jgi:hypothetical protein